MRLPACKDRAKVRFDKDASDFFALVSLDFDLAIFYRAPRSAGLLHRPGQPLLLRQTDADKAFHHRNGLAAATGLLPDDIHPPAALAPLVVSFVVGVGR